MARLSRPPHPLPARKRRSLRVLVTGGPTKAFLDRVRYISNYSTGAIAHEICKALHNQDVTVAAVIGPSSLDFSGLGLKICRRVETFEQMRRETHNLCRTFRPDVVVFSAAVLDFLPVKVAAGKVSSTQKTWVIRLKPAPKIIDEIGRKYPKIRRVGFKLQWDEGSAAKATRFGEKVLREKKLDALVLNSLSRLKKESHPALLFRPGERPRKAKTKKEIARWISEFIVGQ